MSAERHERVGTSDTDRAPEAFPFPEQAFRGLVEHSIVGIYAIGPDGNFRYANPAMLEVFGYSADEFRHVGPLAIGHPDELPDIAAELSALLAGDIQTVDLRHRATRKDGTALHIETRATHAQVDGEPLIIGTLHDISADVTHAAELSEYRDRLEQLVADRTADLLAANRELATFTYSASHDLRAPARSVIGFGDALLEEYGDRLDARGLDYLNRILRAGRRMTQLIDDLLQLSKVTGAAVQHVAVDITKVAQSTLEDLSKIDPSRSVETQVQQGIVVPGDPKLLQILVENLVENAWKYTRDRVPGRIDLGHYFRDGRHHCYVRDNGTGFDPSQARKLFQPFQRLHSNEDFEGSGIGLATVRRIVERHRGSVWAEGVPGEGATFWFSIPERGEAQAPVAAFGEDPLLVPPPGAADT